MSEYGGNIRYPPGMTIPSDLRKVRNSSGRGFMIRARGDRRWYLVYHDENEQFKISCPVTAGKSIDSDIATELKSLKRSYRQKAI
jgi:hypothetical protein